MPAGQWAGTCSVRGSARLVLFDHPCRPIPGLNWMCPGLGGRYSDGDGRFTGCCLPVAFKDVMLEVSLVQRCAGGA